MDRSRIPKVRGVFARMACKPGFVRGGPLQDSPWMTIPLVPPLPAGSSCQPGSAGAQAALQGKPCARSLFGIAPGGACLAGSVARPAVGSYPTVSPLPRDRLRGGLISVALSLGSPPPGVTRHRACMEPGLSSNGQAARGHPAIRARGEVGGPGRGVKGACASRLAPGASRPRTPARCIDSPEPAACVQNGTSSAAAAAWM